MIEPEVYSAAVPDWATCMEVVVPDPTIELPVFRFASDSKNETLFVLGVISTPNGLVPPFLDARMQCDLGDNVYEKLIGDERAFISAEQRMFVFNQPHPGKWEVSVEGGSIPFAMHLMAFHPAIPPNSPPSAGPSGASPFKCRACKTTAKALALSIVAAAALPALPKALLAAVAAYLGESTVIAAAFIASVIGDVADMISEKLCKRVGLC